MRARKFLLWCGRAHDTMIRTNHARMRAQKFVFTQDLIYEEMKPTDPEAAARFIVNSVEKLK